MAEIKEKTDIPLVILLISVTKKANKSINK